MPWYGDRSSGRGAPCPGHSINEEWSPPSSRVCWDFLLQNLPPKTLVNFYLLVFVGEELTQDGGEMPGKLKAGGWSHQKGLKMGDGCQLRPQWAVGGAL